MKELQEMTNRLEEIIERQQMKLWRLARNAKKHGCSKNLVNAICEEGWTMHDMKAYPERILNWKTKYELKYAFKAV